MPVGRILSLSLLLVALSAVPAGAVQSVQQLRGSLSPRKAGSAKKPAPVALTVNPFVELNAGDAPFATSSAVIWLDRNLRFAGAKTTSCTAAKAQMGTCPTASRVGRGSAAGVALGLTENLSIVAYNGPRGGSLLMLVEGTEPLSIKEVLVGELTPARAPYGTKLSVTIPPGLQQPVPGVFATLTDFKLTVGSKKSRFVTLACCPKGGLRLAGDFAFTDDTSQRAETRAACSR